MAAAVVGFLPLGAQTAPITVTMIGKTNYFHQHHAEVAGVPEAEQAIYQSSWTGNMGLRVAGLKPEPYRVHLAYTEMDMNAPRTRVFDILLNQAVVKKEVCIFNAVGNRRVLSFDFTVTPQDGVITYFQRQSVKKADFPSFTLMRLYDSAGNLAVESSAYQLQPPDWKLRDYLDRIYRPFEPNSHTAPPWPGSYKIKPNETSRLTAADVVGPDGIVYPNWTHVGIPGGIPELATTLSAAAFGLTPDGAGDSSAALQRGIDALEARGGGVLFIPAGRYYLDRPVFITGDHCVLRGAGVDKTRFISRFTTQGRAPEFIGLPANAKIGPSTVLPVWVDPKGMTNLSLTANNLSLPAGKLVKSEDRTGLWETQIQYTYAGKLMLKAVGPGPAELKLTASYRDGTKREALLPVVLTAAEALQQSPNGPLGIINFYGTGPARSPKLLLASDGKRGDTGLDLTEASSLRPGDRIQIEGPETDRWAAVLRTKLKKNFFRGNQYQVESVQGRHVSIPEALRIEFPTIDGSYVQVFHPILRSGIEDLGFEQVVPTQVHAIVFSYDWECWARRLEIVHTGDKAIYMPASKRSEVRDAVLDRSWCNDGGSAYVGWETAFDCLMENVTTYDMRHAPVVQWGSSGNVIRSSVFHGSDTQWHAGWTNENLYEGLIVESSQLAGSYGNGGWAAGPDDEFHGPNGPRNVVYNCNITSVKMGLWLGGMNENWLILHNRFIVGRGPAIFMKDASFDHIIRDNVFVMLEPQPAAIYFGTADCTGVELIGNRFYGPVKDLIGGAILPSVNEDNRIRASGGISRPRPAVRSIYEWEQAHRAEIDRKS